MVNNSAQPLKIAIVGGGPGGLATAIALDKVPNVKVALYEKAQVLREVGAGISIGQNSWNVLELLGVAESLTSGHPTTTVLNLNGRTGEELSKMERKQKTRHTPIRTQRTKLQSTLLQHVKPGVIRYGKKLERIEELGETSVGLFFSDGTQDTANLVIGADGIRSVVRDSAWPDFPLEFTGTTIWRALLPRAKLTELDPRFDTTGWWHLPNSHVWFSPVGEGLAEIAAREYQDPAIHGASKSTWGVPVTNEYVESHFTEYLPQIQAAIKEIPMGDWREFAAFSGPELSQLTAWNNKVVLVGDASHALSGAFGSGAGFAMEDGWIIAQALVLYGNDLSKALPLFDEIRVPYYARMYSHLEDQKSQKAETLSKIQEPTERDRVRSKVLGAKRKDMTWIHENDIGKVWEAKRSSLTGSRADWDKKPALVTVLSIEVQQAA
jgi:salicylate hydroxylase